MVYQSIISLIPFSQDGGLPTNDLPKSVSYTFEK